MAGQILMQDFVDWRIPLWLRRLITMAPTVIVAAWVSDATQALVVSQVVLSFVLPVPLITLVLFTGSPRVMGRLANSPVVSARDLGHGCRAVDQCLAFGEPDAARLRRYVLEDSVRITGQLIDRATGAHIWADRFDGVPDQTLICRTG
jgi:hypothetical protein